MGFSFSFYFKIILLSIMLVSFNSCYSVRLMSTKGAPMPAEDMTRDDWYRDKLVVEIDTVLKAGITTDDITLRVLREGCETGKLFSVEYKNTFSASLLYIFSFGNKRKVHLKYVCMKPED